ncbi:MAG: hypothetical protein HQL59_09315 [Magnetococcales bacterium]|nr:hypothetical protein [Magnetococcales bacterium]
MTMGVYDDLADDLAEEMKAKQTGLSRLELSLSSALDANPDREAANLTRARRIGVSPETAAAIPLEVAKEALLAEIDLPSLLADAPATSGFFADPKNARIAHDDLETLRRIEMLSRRDGWWEGLKKRVETIPDQWQAAMGGILQAAGEHQQSQLASGLDLWERVLGKDRIPEEMRSVSRAMATLGQQEAEVGRDIYSAESFQAKQNAPDLDHDSAQYYLTEIVGAVLGMAPAVFATGATGSPAVGAAMIGGQVGGERYGKSRAAGRTPGGATQDALVYGVAELLTERLSLGVLTEKGGLPLRRLLKAALAEGGQEMVTEAIQLGYDNGVLDEETPLWEALRRLVDAGIIGAGAGGGLALALSPGAKRAEQQRQRLAELGEAASDSRLRARIPDRFRAFLAKVKENGLEAIRIPVDPFTEYFQGVGQDPSQIAEQLGISGQFNEARLTGGDVVIPAETYLEHLAPTEHHAGLLDDIRLDPEEPTYRESRDAARIHTDVAKAAEGAVAAVRKAGSASRVVRDVEAQLIAAGKLPDVAAHEAALHGAFFSTMAERAGIDPWELYQSQNLRIRKALPEGLRKTPVDELDLLIDRARQGSGPKLPKYPVIAALRERGGVRTGSPIAGELAAMDITPGRFPGLFHRDSGLTDFDAETDDNGYVKVESVMEALRAEVAGKPWRTGEENEAILAFSGPVNDLVETLNQLGLGLDAPNVEIKEALERLQQEDHQQTETLFQPLNPGVDLDREVTIVQVPEVDIPQGKFLGEAIKEAEDALFQKNSREPVRMVHPDLPDGGVVMSKNDFKHAVNSFRESINQIAHFDAARVLPELFSSSVLVETHADAKTKEGVRKIHRLYGAFSHSGWIYVAKMTVKEHEGQTALNVGGVYRLYNLGVPQKRTAPGRREVAGVPTPSPQAPLSGEVYPSEEVEADMYSAPGGVPPRNRSVPAEPDSVSLRRLLEGINDNEKRPFINTDGTGHFRQEARGSIRIGENETLITLFGKANLSTFLHGKAVVSPGVV